MRAHAHEAVGAAAGALVAAPLSHWLGMPAAIFLVVVSALTAVLPDVDHPYSLAGRLIPRWLWPWYIDGRVYRFSKPTQRGFRHGRYFFGHVTGHRMGCHSLGFAAMIAALVGALAWLTGPLSAAAVTLLEPLRLSHTTSSGFYDVEGVTANILIIWFTFCGPWLSHLAPFIGLQSFVGCVSHLFCDRLSPSPMMLGWPFTKRPFKKPRWLPSFPVKSLRGRVLEWALLLPSLLVILCVFWLIRA